jgi:hypothetical protein
VRLVFQISVAELGAVIEEVKQRTGKKHVRGADLAFHIRKTHGAMLSTIEEVSALTLTDPCSYPLITAEIHRYTPLLPPMPRDLIPGLPHPQDPRGHAQHHRGGEGRDKDRKHGERDREEKKRDRGGEEKPV